MKEHKKLVYKSGVSVVVNGGNLEKDGVLYKREKPIWGKMDVKASATAIINSLSIEIHKK